jgi:bifunctional DNase/RNase
VQEIDARPSDAIALAVRMNCPIYVAEEVMANAGAVVPATLRNMPLRKGLETLAQYLAHQRQANEQKLQERKEQEATQSQLAHQEAHQKLLAHLFGREE